MIEPVHPEVAILNAALELPAALRPAYLDQACAGNAALRQQVEALLHAHEKADGFLDAPLTGSEIRSAMHVPLTEKPGDLIGRYKLLQQIGEGGCGVVYMAEQEEPVRRRVALKVIKLGMDTKQVIARFEAERQALALMDHPNIAKVFDAGATEAGRPYFVMELVRGVKFTEYCREHEVSVETRLRLFMQVCQAIQHAHQKGIIHRDIKPSNILVTADDGVPLPKVIDFGIAKATQGRLTDQTLFTAFEQFIGTPAYTSPEQAAMSGVDIDTRADIYSLGVLLYELLTGRTPFDQRQLLGSGLDEMRRTIREKEPPKPSTRLTQELEEAQSRRLHLPATQERGEGDISASSRRLPETKGLIRAVRGDLDWIVMKCLEKDRARRYETANGLALDIERHLHNEPVSARPPSRGYQLRKLAQRNRLAVAAAGVVTAAVLLALVVLAVSRARVTREKNEKERALQTARASEQRAKEELFVSLRSQAKARHYSRQMGQRLDSLTALAEAARIRPDPGLRDDAIAAMALPDVRRGPKWRVSQTNCIAIEFDPDYRRYALLEPQGLTVRNIPDGQDVRRLDLVASNFSFGSVVLAFSPDGRFLSLVRRRGKSQLWSLESGEQLLQDPPQGDRRPSFSSDSRLIAFAEGNFIRCFDVATGREQGRWETAGLIYTLNFHPRDRRIAVGYEDKPVVSIYDSGDGRELAQFPLGPGVRGTAQWDPEGGKLAVGSSDPPIQIWDVDARQKVASLEGHLQDVSLLTFHPGGNWLASSGWDGVLRVWDLAVGRQALQVPLGPYLRFSKDGRWFGSFWVNDDEVQLLEFIPSQEYFALESRASPDHPVDLCAEVSPDCRLLATAATDGVRVWDWAVRREVALIPSARTESLLFEPDGHALLTCSSHTGLQRWAIRASTTNAAELTLGPPQRIALPFKPVCIRLDRANQLLAVISEPAGQALLLDTANYTPRVGPLRHAAVSFVALSPDGKWLATSGWHSDRVRLWRTQTGERAGDWATGGQTFVSITPDSRELVIGRGGGFSFVDIETLETRRVLRRGIGLYPGDQAFTPDGKLMAMEIAAGVIHLYEVSTARLVAQFENPFGDRSSRLTFAPDGTKLIVVVQTYTAASSAAGVNIWDLRAIRARLKPMGLDWDWPEFPPPAKSEESRPSPARSPLKVRVLTGEKQ